MTGRPTPPSAPTRRRFALSAAGLLTLAACGPNGSGGGAGGRRDDGILRVGLPGAADSLDPFVAEFAAAAILLNQIHAPLWSYRPGQGLAERFEPSEGARVWTAHLREGLRWSDGAPLTAADVVWAVRHGLRPDSTYSGIGDLRPIADVGAPDARTVRFALARPLGVFPETMREFYPIARQAWDAHGAGWTRPENFVGAGPYLPSSATQLSVSLTRNPNHFAADRVAIAEIDVQAVDDGATRLRMYQAGDLHLAFDPPWESLGQPGIAPGFSTAPRLVYLKPNHRRPLLADARVRRALWLAADRDFLAEAYYRAYAAPAWSAISGDGDAAPALMGQRRDQAAALIRAAGAEGAELELMQSGAEREGVAIALADDWAKIGLKTAINRTDPTGLYAAVDEGRFDLALSRFDRGLKADPWRMLEPFAPGGFAANFGWSSPALGAALDMIRAEPDAGRRAMLARAAEERTLAAEQAIIPLLRESMAWLATPALRDRGAVGDADARPLFWADLALVS